MVRFAATNTSRGHCYDFRLLFVERMFNDTFMFQFLWTSGFIVQDDHYFKQMTFQLQELSYFRYKVKCHVLSGWSYNYKLKNHGNQGASLRHLHQLLTEEISRKQTQQKLIFSNQ